MKKSLFFSFLIVTLLLSCNQNRTKVSSKINISGTVKNNVDPFILLKCFYNGFKSYKAEIDQNGQFQLIIDANESKYYTLQLDNESTNLFIEPGDEIIIECDSKTFLNSINFQGGNVIVNTYLKDRKLRVIKDNLNIEEIFSLPTKQFINFNDSILAKKQNDFEIFTNQNDISQEFIVLEKAQSLYNWASWMYYYPDYYVELTGRSFENLDNSYFNYIEKLNFNNEGNIKSQNFTDFLHEYINSEIANYLKDNPNHKKSDFSNTELWFSIVSRDFNNQTVKDKLYYDGITNQFNKNSENIMPLLTRFNDLCKNETLKNVVNFKYKEFENIHKGNTAPSIEFYSSDETKFSLEDFKGKYIYIDVWASWCGPCIKEYEIIRNMKVEFAEKNIHFISLSVDDNMDKWKDAIEKRKMKGLQFICNDGWDSPLIEKYKILNLPRFILIDPQGRLLDSKAPRPSENIIEKLHNLNLSI